jgi:class 3 adenylate cyclase
VRADEYFAVFAKAASALDASVTLQRELGAHRWPGDVAVRVRVGIHTGDITMTTSGYIGLPVNTAARVCAAGHGGQILVSGEAVHAAEGSTPGGIAFRSLGSHELRGLPKVTEIYQVEAAGLSTRFPTLRLSGE